MLLLTNYLEIQESVQRPSKSCWWGIVFTFERVVYHLMVSVLSYFNPNLTNKCILKNI